MSLNKSRKERKTPDYITYLRVNDWESSYRPVNNLLLHLMRKNKSEGTRKEYLWHLYKFCQFSEKTPDELVKIRRDVVEKHVQSYADSFGKGSPRYTNLTITILKAFYAVNGYKRERALDLETYHTPPRFRITEEHIPSKSEIYRMVDSAHCLRDRAIVLTLYSSGLRNSTLRSILFRDISDELRKGISNIMIPVYPEMKEVDPGACKGNIPYYTFISDEATESIKLYINDRVNKYGKPENCDPLFCSGYNQITKEERNKRILTARELQIIVKSMSERANIIGGDKVYPRCIRKSYETVLNSPLIDGSNMDLKTQEFLMGHILPGSQDRYFDKTNVERIRSRYSMLKFGRPTIDNKFKVLRSAISKAFEGSDIDPEKVMEEYIRMKQTGNNPLNQLVV